MASKVLTICGFHEGCMMAGSKSIRVRGCKISG